MTSRPGSPSRWSRGTCTWRCSTPRRAIRCAGSCWGRCGATGPSATTPSGTVNNGAWHRLFRAGQEGGNRAADLARALHPREMAAAGDDVDDRAADQRGRLARRRHRQRVELAVDEQRWQLRRRQSRGQGAQPEVVGDRDARAGRAGDPDAAPGDAAAPPRDRRSRAATRSPSARPGRPRLPRRGGGGPRSHRRGPLSPGSSAAAGSRRTRRRHARTRPAGRCRPRPGAARGGRRADAAPDRRPTSGRPPTRARCRSGRAPPPHRPHAPSIV